MAALSGLIVGLALTLAIAIFDERGGPNPCRFLDAADIASVVGSAVEPGTASTRVLLVENRPRWALCRYGTSSSFGDIVVGEQRPGRAGFLDARQRAKRGGGGLPAYHSLPGVGDEAYSAGGAVFVLVNDTFVVVLAERPTRDFELPARQLAAHAVLEHR